MSPLESFDPSANVTMSEGVPPRTTVVWLSADILPRDKREFAPMIWYATRPAIRRRFPLWPLLLRLASLFTCHTDDR
jgi:hypothetical protein